MGVHEVRKEKVVTIQEALKSVGYKVHRAKCSWPRQRRIKAIVIDRKTGEVVAKLSSTHNK